MTTYQGGWAVIGADDAVIVRATIGVDDRPAEGERPLIPITHMKPEPAEGERVGATYVEHAETDEAGRVIGLTWTFTLEPDPWAWPVDLLVEGEPGAGPFRYARIAADRSAILAVGRPLERPRRRSEIAAEHRGKAFDLPFVEVRPPLAWGEEHGAPQDAIGEDRVTRTWPVVVDVPALRRRAIDEVNAAAGAARTAIATSAPLQDLVYEGKRREAERFAADPAPDAKTYPLLSAEVGITAADVAGVAAVVNAKATLWAQAAAAIERVRLSALAAVEAIADDAGRGGAAAIRNVLDGLDWPS